MDGEILGFQKNQTFLRSCEHPKNLLDFVSNQTLARHTGELIIGVSVLSKSNSVSPQQCFADERENIFETTSWSTYLRYVTTNRSLVYVLIFIIFIFVLEVKTLPFV